MFAAALIVVSALHLGGFWLRSAEVVGVGSLALVLLVVGMRRVDLTTTVILAALGALATWWFLRAVAIGQPLSVFPFGAAVVGFGAAFAAVRPLHPQYKDVAATVLASIGALEALVGFYGVTMRSYPLAIPDQNLWRLASTLTYSNAAGLILAMSLLVALGLNERWWYSRGLVCICAAGLLATQSRAAVLGALLGLLFVPIARYRLLWLPLTLGAIAGAVAVATALSTKPVPMVAAVGALCLFVSVVVKPVPIVLGSRRRVGLTLLAALVVVGIALAALHSELSRRLISSASLFDRNPEWSSAYHQFLGSPGLGVGPDRVIPLVGGNGTFAHFAHNEYLQIADDAGLVGLALLVIAILMIARTVRRTDLGTSCALGALIAFAFCGAFDFDWHVPMIGLMAGWVAGLASSAPLRRPRVPKKDSAGASLRPDRPEGAEPRPTAKAAV
ncbi:MAG TPA: O-antigen ligase family protein [Acidimicrobiales bacterium]|nr:O-antigen ligase family protein [Acidimicrobiales bacterium]